MAFALGILIVLAIAGITAYAAWTLYSDLSWRSTAQESSASVAEAIRAFSVADDEPPAPVDAVAGMPAAGQVALSSLPYADDIPRDVSRFRLSAAGALSVLTDQQALCSGVSLDMTAVGADPQGAFSCGDARAPVAPVGLEATPRDSSVLLDWTPPDSPVEDYLIAVSDDEGRTWAEVDDGVSATSQAVVRSLINGRDYLFRVVAANILGQSAAATTASSPMTQPSAPIAARAEGGFTATVAWQAPRDDGGRPITGYLVTGDPGGECETDASSTRCEITDLPAASGYTFTVRAVNEAGAGTPSLPTAPVTVYSVPGRPVALTASPGDGLVILTWTPPLRDGNIPITDYRVDYRPVGSQEWNAVQRPPSIETRQVIAGLTNGTAYEFQVRAVNEVGVSDPPLMIPTETPATVPGQVLDVQATASDGSVALAWSPAATDPSAPVTDYIVEFRTASSGTSPWNRVDSASGPATSATVANLQNGTRYGFRVTAVNRLGSGPPSPRALAMPIGPPGPVTDVESEGSLKDIALTWRPPANDGGRKVLGYRVEYRPSTAPDWITLPQLPADETEIVIGDLVGGESYDIRIVAVTRAGIGPSGPDGTELPTLMGVIADETPPAPARLTAVPGDGLVTLSWEASPTGRKSPITAYTVTGTPAGTCTTVELTCEIRGLTNGVRYSFTVNASNQNITGPESEPATTMPMVFNEASGGTVTTYTSRGRTYRVHTFTSDGTFTVTRADQPFSVLVVAGGGGNVVAPDGSVYPGAGGGIIDARRVSLARGTIAVTVGAGGITGVSGGASSLAGVGAAAGGLSGSPDLAQFGPRVTSRITGRPVAYGGDGTVTSGPGPDGLGVGGGGPTPNRGGAGVVIIRYEVPR